MNKELKEKWLKALRSGEYKQGNMRLRRNDEQGDLYCCLGVYADCLVKEGIGSWKIIEGSWAYVHPDHKESTKDITELRVEIMDRENQNKAMIMNDAGNRSFTEIADYFEVNLKVEE